MKNVSNLPLPSPERWFRPLTIAVASLLVTAVVSVGGVKDDDTGSTDLAVDRHGEDRSASVVAGDETTTTVAGGPDAGSTAAGGPAPRTGAGQAGGGPAGRVAVDQIPDHGLKTQGVTDKEVKVGYTYNVAACGDTGTLDAMLGSAATGDPKKAIDAFTRHINDTGGVGGGRKLKVVVVDDGGAYCPEKNMAAAIKLAHEEKVFLAIPGLHVLSDYLIEQKIPVFGGRDDPTSLARIGANGIMLTEAIEPTLEKWSAFGRYYLDSKAHKPCLIHPETGPSGDWDAHEKILVAKFAKYDMKFTDIIVYEDNPSTAQQQASTAAFRAKNNGCDQVYFMAVNPIALIFFTQAATQANWFPTWTFTSYMTLSDSELGGRLMDQRQWENAVGLSTRVPPGQHRAEGNCKRIYQKYHGTDDQSEAAYTQVVCAQLLSVAEIMRRAHARTGILTGSSLLLGADAVRGDFYYDATVPLRWSFPGLAGPFKTKAFSHYTVVDWSSAQSKYLFPEFPNYWEVMGPGKGGAQDLRPQFK